MRSKADETLVIVSARINIMHSQWINIGGYNWAGFGLVFVTDCTGKKIIIWQHLMTAVFVIRKQQMDHLTVRKFIVLSNIWGQI